MTTAAGIEVRPPLPRRVARIGCVPPAYSPISVAALLTSVSANEVSGGRPLSRLGHLLCERFGAEMAVLAASGTQALTIAIEAACRQAGRSPVVALPAYTCFEVATAAIGAGARIVLYDIDPYSLAPDLDSLRRALRDGAGVAVIAPLYGIPVDWDAIDRLSAEHGTVLVEDAAQGYGAMWREHPHGSLGPLSVLSFGRGKGWSGGGGGAVLARFGTGRQLESSRPAPPSSTAGFRAWMYAAAQCVLGRPSLYGIPAAAPWLKLGQSEYHEPETVAALSAAAAMIAARTMPLADAEVALRRVNAVRLIDAIEASDARMRVYPIRPHRKGTAGFLRCPVRVRSGLARVSDVRRARRLGVAPSYPATLADLPAVQRCLVTGAAQRRWLGAELLVRELVTLPTHSRTSDGIRAEIVRLFE